MNKQVNSYTVLGLMSGTSLDGLDLCLANFKLADQKWTFEIIKAQTTPYSNEWLNKLINCELLSGEQLINLHFEYGKFLGKTALNFINECQIEVDFIASHGHTIFHQPEKGFTFQLGHGAALASSSKHKVTADFRSLDVALGGQGAPLVPIGDKELFSEFGCCINFGGICNFSYNVGDKLLAYDIVPCNMVLNYLMQKHFSVNFDLNGNKARSGKLDQKLYNELNSLDYFEQQAPKSLGKEWIFEQVIPRIDNSSISAEDKLHTYTAHIAFQLQIAIKKLHLNGKILLSGGGCKNEFLIDLLRNHELNLFLPNELIIDFKEALIFAYLGVKRIRNEVNVNRSVTAARKDSSSGCIYLP